MNTNEFHIAPLTDKELRETRGGFFFLLLPALAFSIAEAAVAWGPLIAAGTKGWNDHK